MESLLWNAGLWHMELCLNCELFVFWQFKMLCLVTALQGMYCGPHQVFRGPSNKVAGYCCSTKCSNVYKINSVALKLMKLHRSHGLAVIVDFSQICILQNCLLPRWETWCTD